MDSNYQEALALTLGFEGGYYAGDEARDPNPTNFGVTQQTYDTFNANRGRSPKPVKDITKGEVENIYSHYWTGAHCDKLPRLTALCVFDMSINAGPLTAVRMLQQALGTEADARWGPKTEAALERVLGPTPTSAGRHAPSADSRLAQAVCWKRIRYYVNLAKSERLRPNLLSWVHRVLKFQETYF